MAKQYILSEFVKRVFKSDHKGTKITNYSPDQFEYMLNDREPIAEFDGYAPFCKLLIFENWTDAKVGVMPLTEDNAFFVKSGYEARQDDELPVLSRWLEGILAPQAKYLCVVLYDEEQMRKEGEMIDAPWGVVAILGQNEDKPQPMTPVTMMRNSLGIEEGGSGVPVDHEAYMEAVEFWDKHALVKDG